METATRIGETVQKNDCGCCREDIQSIVKWIDAVTDELIEHPKTTTQIANKLWNLRVELLKNLEMRDVK